MIDEPRAEGPRAVALMELEDDLVIALRQIEWDDVVVLADRPRLVAREDVLPSTVTRTPSSTPSMRRYLPAFATWRMPNA
jgi:hypothetical protein